MRILVCGGSEFYDCGLVHRTLDGLMPEKTDAIEACLSQPDTVVMNGGPTGADALADQWAVVNWVRQEVYPAELRPYGRSGPIRNQTMIDEAKPDLVVAIPGGDGTADVVRF
jgi:YspA, cpYpsA-related SLOG family